MLHVTAAELPAGLDGRLRVIDPEAAHPAQLVQGAIDAGPRDLLEELRPAVEASFDDADTSLAAAILGLIALARIEPGELSWLSELALVDTDGEVAPAGELILAGSALDAALSRDAPLGVVAQALVEEYGAKALRVLGVGDALVVVRGADAVSELDKGDDFLDTLEGVDLEADPPVGVRDLEWLTWPEGLPLLARLPAETQAYVRFWGADEPLLAGLLPREVLTADADPLLRGLFDEVPYVDPAVLRFLGCRDVLPTSADDLLDLLDRLGDPARDVTREQARALLMHVADHCAGMVGEPPENVRAVAPDGSLVCVPGPDAVLVDSPDLLPLMGKRPVMPVPAGLAAVLSELLDIPVASVLGSFAITGHDPLTCLDVDGHPVVVSWRASGEAQGADGLGRLQAWRDGAWDRRHAYVARLRSEATPLDRLEDDLGPG